MTLTFCVSAPVSWNGRGMLGPRRRARPFPTSRAHQIAATPHTACGYGSKRMTTRISPPSFSLKETPMDDDLKLAERLARHAIRDIARRGFWVAIGWSMAFGFMSVLYATGVIQ